MKKLSITKVIYSGYSVWSIMKKSIMEIPNSYKAALDKTERSPSSSISVQSDSIDTTKTIKWLKIPFQTPTKQYVKNKNISWKKWTENPFISTSRIEPLLCKVGDMTLRHYLHSPLYNTICLKAIKEAKLTKYKTFTKLSSIILKTIVRLFSPSQFSVDSVLPNNCVKFNYEMGSVQL